DATTQLNVENLASGIYLIKYNDDKRSETIRITKQ
ncbi:MAG: T9SS type A sorting domain-containing protein, partial [Bacteroidetes bacterium]|nr:T9SS type A sorting domain-containing protein [Bacteroidota bacterium]